MSDSIIIPLAMSPQTVRLIVLVVLAILAVGLMLAVGVFVYSIWKQRKYNTTALPSLGVEEEDEESEEDIAKSSAFALDLVKADPVSKGAYATRLDEDVDFTQFTPHDEIVARNDLPTPKETKLPEAALPMPPGLSPMASPVSTPNFDALGPLISSKPKDYGSMTLDSDEPDELPPFQSSGSYELTPELEASMSPRMVRSMDDDEELDFTPVIEGNGAETARTQEFRKLRMPTVDNIDSITSSNSETEEITDNQYVGRRRDKNETDPNAL